MRAFGILLLVLACAAAGNAAAYRLKNELRSLELLRLWTEDAACRIRHEQTALPELLYELSCQKQYERFRFVNAVLEGISPMQPPQLLWEQAVHSDGAVPAAARDPLLHLGAKLGTTDCEGQLAALGLCAAQLENEVQAARERCVTKGKLCRSLGLLGGAMLGILLL